MPFVSIIMNGFNSAAYLREALDSALRQTFTDWELVFWDNRSDDDTEEIVRSIGDARIHFHVSSKRLSLAEGRNEAMAKASGRWLAFLDCDDRWAPDKLERQIERLREHGGQGVGMVYGRTRSFSARGDEGETIYRYAGRPLPEGRIARHMLMEGNLILPVSALVSREAIDVVGPIPPEFTFAEDYYLFTAVADRFEVLCVQDALCGYRVHPASATARNKLRAHEEGLMVLEHFAGLLTPAELRRRRRVYGTLIGIELARKRRRRIEGVMYLLRHGSLAFLLGGTLRTLHRRYVLGNHPYS